MTALTRISTSGTFSWSDSGGSIKTATMATTPTTAGQTANTKSVDTSLWWDSFTLLLTDLENASLSSDIPPHLVKKLKDNHAWFLDTVALFKPPNQKSREALNSEKINIGSHQLTVQPELRDAALKISSSMCLDEVQSYILVKRSIERNSLHVDQIIHELPHLVMLQYYIERQCLLKCTRQIFMHALYIEGGSKEGNGIREEAQKLVSDGLESRLLSVLQELLSSGFPEYMDVDLLTLWAEETLTEDNLVLDILFLAYYDSFCICNGKQWKKLCLLYEGIMSGTCNFGQLALSVEAMHSIYQAKIQLLLILIETLDLENLLQMVHDEMPFRQGSIPFSFVDIQDIDVLLSSFNAFEMKESGPLILAWAVFLCLISSLPGKQDDNVQMEIDHVGYVRQAFEVSSLSHFLEILQTNILKDSDGPSAGYISVMRTFISAFIASYEISLELEDNTIQLILDILCEIYRGEESLCIQFWDKDSFIDGPIRCLLCNFESEFPSRIVELVRLLSALCEGTWPAYCVYNFLDKSVGISTLFDVNSDSLADNGSQLVEAGQSVNVPGVEGLFIPSKTHGRLLKVVNGNTALVRWEYRESGVLLLLLRLAQKLYLDSTDEVLLTLDLLNRLVSFNMAVCYALMDIGNPMHVETSEMNGHTVKTKWVNLVEIICRLVKNLSTSCGGTVIMSMGVNILAKMLKCSPSHVITVALKVNLFDVALGINPSKANFNVLSSGSFLLPGRLAKLLLIDCELNDSCCPLTISVLEFTLQLVETGLENDVVLALLVFSLQYVLVNHEYWKYKVKHVRWKVTLKVLEVLKKCVLAVPHSEKLGEVVQDILLCDSSIHNVLFRIGCTTTQALEKLHLSRAYGIKEIEGLQLAICSVLDILSSMLSNLSKDTLPNLPVFHQSMLSSTTKPISVVTAMLSLMSCFRNPTIQVGAARVLSKLFVIADSLLPYVYGSACFGLDDNQITEFRHTVKSILCDQQWNEDLFVATFQLLTSAALYQPAFIVAVIAPKENTAVQLSDANAVKLPMSHEDVNLTDVLLKYVGRSDDLVNSNPRVLLYVLNFLKALWQGAGQFTNILDLMKSSEKFWRKLANSVLLIAGMQKEPSGNPTDTEALNLAYRYQCQSAVFQIMAYEVFLHKKLLHADSRVKQSSESSKVSTEIGNNTRKAKDASLQGLVDVFSSWCESSVMGDLIESYVSCEYHSDVYLRAKIAAGLFIVHVLRKLKAGDMGPLSVSLIENIHTLSSKLSNLSVFSELLDQYTQRGYSEGKDLNSLILSDLYYHLQGEFEGRAIDPGPFKELSRYLLDCSFLHTYRQKYDGDLFTHASDVFLSDLTRLRADLGFHMWDYSEWKASKAVAETMLCCLQNTNSMELLVNSKLSALKALITFLFVYEENSIGEKTKIGGKIPEQLVLTCINHICQCLRATIDSLAPILDASEGHLDFLAAQAELLLHLVRSGGKMLPLPVCVLVLKTSGFGLKVLVDFKPSIAVVGTTVQLFLLLLLSSISSSCRNSLLVGAMEMESVEALAEVSNACLGLLPILCKCIEPIEYCTLSLTSIDLILKGFLTPNTWFQIMQKHLPLTHVVQKLQEKNSLASIPVILKFFLTLARVRGGAEMLLTAGFFSSMRVLFADLTNHTPFSMIQTERNFSYSEKTEKIQHIWGLGLAVVTAMIHSLGDGSSSTNMVDHTMAFFFSEKAHLISYYLSSPNFPSDEHDKKRARAQKSQTSLGVLKETEHTLMLLCMLAKHQNSWIKVMKEVDSPLRERSIHLLAFISRGSQQLGDSPNRVAPLLCHPVLKEEIEWQQKPSFINSRNGWFALSPLSCMLNPRSSAASARTTALMIKDQATENTDPAQTYFSDLMAIQIYRLAFFLLKFLCLQAEGAAKRADDVGFVDISHFPELPMPDILHGLQDQAIVIVIELCEANKLKQVSSEIQSVCILLLKIIEMALYLEFCVSQICGIRPVLGRVEDFSKELKLLMKGTEGHAFLKAPVKFLRQIVSFVYPGFFQTEGLL